MRSLDFTLKKYEQLCKVIFECGYVTSTIYSYLGMENPQQRIIVFRHDVDRSPNQALQLAQLEHDCGIQSTYYFRAKKSVFLPDIIRKIAKLGHEIGYHYETFAECKGDFEKAIALFTKELTMFRRFYPVTTISMHGRPLSRFDNRDLWEKYDFRDHGLFGECYLSINYNKVLYLSDTGRTWHPTRYNVRDHVDGQSLPELETTDDLIRFLQHGVEQPLCLLTHPNRWTDSVLLWRKEWFLDQCFNQIKRFLIWTRR